MGSVTLASDSELPTLVGKGVHVFVLTFSELCACVFVFTAVVKRSMSSTGTLSSASSTAATGAPAATKKPAAAKAVPVEEALSELQ